MKQILTFCIILSFLLFLPFLHSSENENEKEYSFSQFEMHDVKVTYNVDANVTRLFQLKNIKSDNIKLVFDLRKSSETDNQLSKCQWKLAINFFIGESCYLENYILLDSNSSIIKDELELFYHDSDMKNEKYVLEIKDIDDDILGKMKSIITESSRSGKINNNIITMVPPNSHINSFLQIVQWISTLNLLPDHEIEVYWNLLNDLHLTVIKKNNSDNNIIYTLRPKILTIDKKENKTFEIQFIYSQNHDDFSFPDKILININGNFITLINSSSINAPAENKSFLKKIFNFIKK